MNSRFLPRVVLFDLDGTLADTAPDLGGAVNRMRLRRGLAEMPIAALRPVASAGARGMLRVGLDSTPEDADHDALRAEFLQEYASALDQDSRLFDGVLDCLSALKTRGIRWGVVTNKVERFAVPVMRALGLDREAAVLICGDTTPFAKPHPEPLREACRRLSVGVEDAIYVGDDLRDIQAAHAAGMPGIAAAYGYLGESGDITQWSADASVETPLALLALLGAKTGV